MKNELDWRAGLGSQPAFDGFDGSTNPVFETERFYDVYQGEAKPEHSTHEGALCEHINRGD